MMMYVGIGGGINIDVSMYSSDDQTFAGREGVVQL